MVVDANEYLAVLNDAAVVRVRLVSYASTILVTVLLPMTPPAKRAYPPIDAGQCEYREALNEAGVVRVIAESKASTSLLFVDRPVRPPENRT